MKKFKFLLVSVFSLLLMAACSDNDDVMTSTQVPNSVLKSFNERYKGVDDVHWDVVKPYYVARFNMPVTSKSAVTFTHSVWFSYDGRYHQTTEKISFKSLPTIISKAITVYTNKFYPDWEIDDCKLMLREGMGEIYIIEIEKDDIEREISISSTGEIIKDIIDMDDEDEVLPIIISREIYNALQNIFPETYKELVILEIEVEDDEIEIDVIENGRHKEVELYPDYQLKSVEYKISFLEASKLLDIEVMKKLELMAHKAGIDIYDERFQKLMEIEVKNHVKKGITFKIEIEGFDQKIKIDANGKIEIKD